MNNVYNLVIKWVCVEVGVIMEWIDGNIGFKVIMKYLVVWMIGEYVKGEVFLVVFVGED